MMQERTSTTMMTVKSKVVLGFYMACSLVAAFAYHTTVGTLFS